MKLGIGMGALAVTLLAGCSSFAGGAAKEADEHAAHHPPQAMAKADDPKVDQQMKMMQDMHQKMAAAKTPEERDALMKEHMKTMQDGIAMMGQMRDGPGMGKDSTGGGMPMDHDTMKRRMDMMEMMMQTMMDQQGMMAGSKGPEAAPKK